MSLRFRARVLSPRVVVMFIVTAELLVAPPVALAQSDGGGGACLAGVICGNPIDWLHQAISDVLTAFLTTLAHTFGDAIVRFINDVNFITHTPENLSYNNALVRQFTTITQVLADGLLAIVMAILLAVQQLMRLALVDALVILAPLAALLWILPQSQGWGRLWGRLFVGTVFAQAVQVLVLRLGFNLATEFPPLTAAGLLQPLLGIAVLALALKVPGLMGGGAAGGNLVTGLLGTAAGAAVGAGVGVAVRAALGVGTRVASRSATGNASPAALGHY